MRFICHLILLTNLSLFSQVLDFKKSAIQFQIHNTELLLHKKYALLVMIALFFQILSLHLKPIGIQK